MKKVIILFIVANFYFSCQPDPIEEPTITQDKTLYTLDFQGLPAYDIPADNPLTVQGVQLGRMLFYEKSLSKDGSQSCASCHVQGDGFSDKNQFSTGVEKKLGSRQAMPIFNMGYHTMGFFWDGRAATLREQSLKPIQDPLEMNETLPNAVAKLTANKTYRDQFTRVFGDATISSERMALAMEQFMLTLVSGKSKFDEVKQGKATFSAEEERGRKLFFTEFDPTGKVKGAECFHCHAGPNFSNSEMQNNGLDEEKDWKDLGFFNVSKNSSDKAKFKTPSLRNIAVTAPYMHDGRMKTLEEVIDHYNIHVKKSSTLDDLLQYNIQPGGLALNAQDKADLIAFLKTLTDNNYLTNAAYKSPF